MGKDTVSVDIDKAHKLTVDMLKELGLSDEDANICIEILIASDRRGIASHGLARMQRYVDGIKNGMMIPDAEIDIITDSPTNALLDGGGAMGQVAGYKGMGMAIGKAKESGMGFVTVRNSNHYGIAGYYSIMALEEDMIGVSTTNSAPLVCHTFSKEPVLGTNPISVAAPGKVSRGIVIDMATSTIPRGKLEVYNRLNKHIPLVWAMDAKGKATDDPGLVIDNLLTRKGGGLLPLGGSEELTGGHKGYCLATIVELFTGVLSGGEYGKDVYGKGKDKPSGVCHFFGAFDIGKFRSVEEFKEDVDGLMEMLRGAELADDADKIYIPGEKEFVFEDEYSEQIPLNEKVYDNLKELAEEFGLEFDL